MFKNGECLTNLQARRWVSRECCTYLATTLLKDEESERILKTGQDLTELWP